MSHLSDNIFEELKQRIAGDVLTDKLRRYMHSTDGSIFRVEPACVVYPKSVNDVVEVVKFAQTFGLAVHPRGAGSGLCGSAIGKGIVVDFAKYMNRLEELDTDRKTFTCQPGFRFGELEVALKGKGLFFPPDPSSGEYASFGGMYGTNASGAHSVKYGNVADYIVDAEIVLSDGTVTTFSEVAASPQNELHPILRSLSVLYTENRELIETSYPDIQYNVSGYNLRGLVQDGSLKLGTLLGGAEGTFGVVTRLTFRLLQKPDYDSLVVAYFDDIVSSAKAVQMLMPLAPSGIEIMDKSLLEIARASDPTLASKMPAGIDNVLLIEFDGFSQEDVANLAEKAMGMLTEAQLCREQFLAVSDEEKEKFWAVRKAAVPILYLLKGKKKILALVEDAAVPTDTLVEYFQGLYQIFEKHSVQFVIYGHIAKGLLHTRPLLDLKDPHDIDMLKTLADEVFALVHRLGGCISGEHGDGRLRSCYIPEAYGKLADVFVAAKRILDPNLIFNPDIKTVFDGRQMTKFLRYGKDYRAHDIPAKNLVWDGQFLEEVEKCHGCSKCTTVTTATRMCPIYKATRDEAAAPKAKANILRALVSGVIDDSSLYEEAFKHVIDHCVNCGSCSKECPSKVNIPKLSMEARSQYVERFGSELSHRLVVNVELAARTTRKVSSLIKTMMEPKWTRKLMEMSVGLSAERPFTAFARRSLAERVGRSAGNGPRKVLYFAGCYASYIRPEIGEATIKVLKALGYSVIIPEQHCCGIPHLTKGMVDGARDKVMKNVRAWGALIEGVEHVVVSCSSCGLSLMKEWGFVSSDERVEKIREKTIHISTLVNKEFNRLDLSQSSDSVAYHVPCHLKVQEDPTGTIKMLKKIPGLQVEDLNSSCCGMAGSWGLDKSHYDLSVKIGTPMTDKLNKSECAMGATDCPTCNMQMEHLSQKPILHPVEILAKCVKS